MLIYQKKSSRKIVHYSGCRYLKTHMDDNWGTFDSLAEAHAAGYRLCKCCSPIARHYRLEQKQILQYCAEAGLSCYQTDGSVNVTTPYSRWKIITSGRKNLLFLYHQNTNPYWKDDGHISIIPGYHSQAIRKDSIVEYLKSIVEHDAYRQIHPAYIPKPPKAERAPAPKGSKRWHKEQRKATRLKRRSEIRNVMNLIDQLQAANY
jgi:hypothetical protein